MSHVRIAYLIFAYKNPRLIQKITEALSSEDSSFFIHIDKKSNLSDFSAIKGKNIFFTPERVPVYWAEFSGIQAILLLIEQALGSPEKPDYLVLLSGSDYPLRSKDYIRAFLEENKGKEFINAVRMPSVEAGKPISRLNTLRIPSTRPVYRFVVKILARTGLAQRDYRKHLGNLEPYAGNTWWALTGEACRHIVDFVKNNPSVCRYFENTFAPEEMFFHTILGNSAFKSRIARNIMYEDWSNRGGHPAMISAEHVHSFGQRDKLMFRDVYGSGEMLFARKFGEDNFGLLEKIDRMVARKEETACSAVGIQRFKLIKKRHR